MESVDVLHLVISIPLIVLNCLAFVVLKRSKRLPFQIRLLSLNLCFADFLSSVALLFPNTVYGSKGTKSFLVHFFTQVSFFTITAFNLDRFLAFRLPMDYYQILTRRLVCIICLVLWVLSITLSYIRDCYLSPDKACNRYAKMEITNAVSHVFCFIYVLNILIIGHSLYFIRYKLQTIGSYKTRSATNTFKKVSVISVMFLAGYLPGIIWGLSSAYFADTPTDLAFRFAAGLGHYVNYVMDPIWYVLRFEECKYQLKLLLFSCGKDKRESIIRSRNEHFATYFINPKEKLCDLEKVNNTTIVSIS